MGLISTVGRGVFAGTVGTLAMSGLAYTVRRVATPLVPAGETHYERVGIALTGLSRGMTTDAAFEDPDALMDLPARRRLGEALHFVFGMINAVPLAMIAQRRGRDITPAEGMLTGVALWLGGFLFYLPRLGVTHGYAHMDTQEKVRSMGAHLVYGLGTALALRRRA
jgi:hypothetical protein